MIKYAGDIFFLPFLRPGETNIWRSVGRLGTSSSRLIVTGSRSATGTHGWQLSARIETSVCPRFRLVCVAERPMCWVSLFPPSGHGGRKVVRRWMMVLRKP